MMAKYTVTFTGGRSEKVEADTYQLTPTHVVFQKIVFAKGVGPMTYALDMYPLAKVSEIVAVETREEDQPAKPVLDLVTN